MLLIFYSASDLANVNNSLQVLLSLTILCAICTVGCFAVIALSFALNRTFYQSILQTQHAGWISRVFSRTKDALIASLSSSHSTLLFLSLTINAASMTFFFANGCANNYSQCYQGAGQYNALLMNWISLLTIYPCLSILNTPSLWPHLRRRRFRLLATAACIGMSGALCGTFWDEVFTSTTIDYDNPGCIVPYFHASIPRQVEARLLLASWIPCAWTLIIITVTQLEIQDYTRLTNCLPRLKQLLGLYSTQTNDSIRKESSIKEYSRVILRIKRGLKYFFRIFYVTNYIYIQAQPFFHLWRIYWIRHHVRSLLQPPTQFNTLYPPFGDDEKVATELERELDNWDADKWSFGQILTLSLWCPVLMDFVYILIGISNTPLLNSQCMTEC